MYNLCNNFLKWLNVKNKYLLSKLGIFKNIEAGFGKKFKNIKWGWNPKTLRTFEAQLFFTGSYKKKKSVFHNKAIRAENITYIYAMNVELGFIFIFCKTRRRKYRLEHSSDMERRFQLKWWNENSW